eukprot:TRINITY_DN2122_c0_g2_i2.p1 TRINITY_DN2122_c0_g2~~TRINITY_DN2122_c0_g2_i2.p1  ORF type:complete len:1087 (+),score=246.41 TRINITY_DN2122_c0_g2_i2:112-3261(+)
MGCGSTKQQRAFAGLPAPPLCSPDRSAPNEQSPASRTRTIPQELGIRSVVASPPHRRANGGLVHASDPQPGSLRDDAADDAELPSPLNPHRPVSSLSADAVSNATFSLLHFNDVYHIQAMAKEPVGGAARFTHLVNAFKEAYRCPILFSGDCYNPSLMSTVTKGKHMTPVLQALDIEAACFGNHDFDFGVDKLIELSKETKCSWVMSNVIDERTGKPIAEATEHHIFLAPRHDGRGTVKVGVMGIAEEEWLACVRDLPPYVKYQSYTDVGRRKAAELRALGCEVVIALTHMRQHNDIAFAESVPEVDIVLGGHDHFYEARHLSDGRLVLKSGTDFKNLSFVLIELVADGPPLTTVERIDVVSAVPEDEHVKAEVVRFVEYLGAKIDKEICILGCELDIRSEAVRTGEVPMGSFIADVMRDYGDADVAFVNSGVLRADVIYHPGPLTIKDILDVVPMEDQVVVIMLTGKQLRTALENGVSKFPAHEGRFLQVSGVKFTFCPDRPPGERLVDCRLEADESLIQADQKYKCVTTSYLCNGGDGFSVLKDATVITDAENSEVLPGIVQKAITGMVSKEAVAQRKESLRQLKRERSGQYDNERTKKELQNFRRAYLPQLTPQSYNRINVIREDGSLTPNTTLSQSLVTTPGGSGASPPQQQQQQQQQQQGDSLAQVSSNIVEVKRAFQQNRQKFPDTPCFWGVDLIPVLGKLGRLQSQNEEKEAVLIAFSDNADSGAWFPLGALQKNATVGLRPNRAPSILRPSASMLALRRSNEPSLAGQQATETQSVESGGSGHASRISRPFMPVPKERTMSFLLNPVTGEERTSAKDVELRSRTNYNRPPGEPRSPTVFSGNTIDDDSVFGMLRRARTLSDVDSAAGKLGRSLHDLVWDGSTDAVLMSPVTEEAVNALGQGSEGVWESHVDTHPALGLGKRGDAVRPLHIAVAKGYRVMMHALLKAGADPTLRSAAGYTAREQACIASALAISRGDFPGARKAMGLAAALDEHMAAQRVRMDTNSTLPVIPECARHGLTQPCAALPSSMAQPPRPRPPPAR